MPRTSPAYRVSETWSTARLGSRLPGTRKYWHRPSSTSSGTPVAALRGGVVTEGALISPLSLRALAPAALVVEPAGDEVPGASDGEGRRTGLAADRHGVRAARVEAAARRRRRVVGERAGDPPGHLLASQPRHAV